MSQLISLDMDCWKRNIIKDDPVRPHLDMEWRMQNGRAVFALEDETAGIIDAVVCVAFTNGVAITEEDLNNTKNPNTAMFYSVWSYTKGAGRKIIFITTEVIKRDYPHINRFVTLSPLTLMAETFHLNNGAKFLKKGLTCQNFEYQL
jgi:hypothetical protein